MKIMNKISDILCKVKINYKNKWNKFIGR